MAIIATACLTTVLATLGEQAKAQAPTAPSGIGNPPVAEDFMAAGYAAGMEQGVVMTHDPALGPPMLPGGPPEVYYEQPGGFLHRKPLRRFLSAAMMPFAPAAHGPGAMQARESWLHRRASVGLQVGYIQGAELINDWTGANDGTFVSLRFGWDFDDYWGAETGFSYGALGMYDSERAKLMQRLADIEAGYELDDPYLDRFDSRRNLDLYQWDASLIYYPWGDADLRPYLSAGLGISRMDFTDRLAQNYDEQFLLVPLAVGVKWRSRNGLAWRIELADNISFGSGSISTTHNLSLTGGVEIRFGGSRTSYWPWNPGRHYW